MRIYVLDTKHFSCCMNELDLLLFSFKCIGDDDNAALCEIYSEEEIKQEVWECDGDRSPRPNEFNFNFIRTC